MKKIIAILLTALIVLGCSACTIIPNNGSSEGDTSLDLVYDVANSGFNVHKYPEGVNPHAKNLVLDNKFTQGFEMYGNATDNSSTWIRGQFMTLGDTVDTSKNVWKLGEWLSKSTLAYGTGDNYSYVKNGNTYTYKNDYKLVAINPVDGTLTLGVNGIKEYNNAERPLAGTGTNNWAHLLAVYSYQTVSLDTITDTKVYVDFKIDSVQKSTAFTPTVPGEQAAQFVLYFMMRNKLNKGRVWFGVPLYDSREEGQPFVYGETFQWDNFTATAIYNVPKDEYFETQPVPGVRYKKLIDLDDSIEFVVSTLISQGAWPQETKMSDLEFNFSNIGWEVPGTINCQATLYHLGCYVN